MVVESDSSWSLLEIDLTLDCPVSEAGVGDVELLPDCSCGDIGAHEICNRIFSGMTKWW